jgi:hypothetical protein
MAWRTGKPTGVDCTENQAIKIFEEIYNTETCLELREFNF